MLLEGGRLEGASWRVSPPGAGSGGAGGCLVVGDGAELPLIQGVPADDRQLQLQEVPTSFAYFIFSTTMVSSDIIMSFCSHGPAPTFRHFHSVHATVAQNHS